MTIALDIPFRGMDTSDSLRQHIEKYAEKLERFADRILSCDVVVKTL